jgi:diguanylate cyclase (GGDEF)-like protein
MQVPGTWRNTGTGIGTYWLEIVVNNEISQPLALRFQRFCGASAIYFFPDRNPSNAPLGQIGRLGANAKTEQLGAGDRLIELPHLDPGTYHLLVQQSNFHLRAGGICGSVTLGSAALQSHARLLNTIKNTVIVTMLLSLGLGSLLLGSQNGERAAPWLAVLCVACAMLIMLIGGLFATLLPPGRDWVSLSYMCSYSALLWLPPALLMLFRHTFAMALPRWLIAVNLLLPLLSNIGVAIQPLVFAQYLRFAIIVWALQFLLALGVLLTACKRRRQYAGFALAATIPLLCAIIYDFYRFSGTGVLEYVTPYAIAFLIVTHGGIFTLKLGAAYQLTARLSAHLQEEVDVRTRELRDKNSKLEQIQSALQRANETLQELSITDGLTRVYNRMYFEQQFEKEWRRCSRHALPLSILMIDADHFKQLNDSAGHLVGDACLQAIAQEIEQHFKRSGELVARYGGEEFIVLLPDTNQNIALAVAEKLRAGIEQLPLIGDQGKSYRVTISVGVSTTVPGIDQQPSQLIATADAALYEAKDAGRNRVHSIPIICSRTTVSQHKLHL